MNYEKQLDKSYKWYADLGIHSVKTGYAGGLPDGHNHHGQYNVRHYRNVVETAAKYHTTLDVHEPIKDTGIRRTYPNMMTREGARGMEWNAWSEGNPPCCLSSVCVPDRWIIRRAYSISCTSVPRTLLIASSGI